LYKSEIIPHLAAIQIGDVESKEFQVTTTEEMQALWVAEEAAVMQAEVRIL